MQDEKKKKGLFSRLVGSNKTKKGSCCCSFEVEEIPDEDADNKDSKDSSCSKDNSCCD